MRQVNIGLLGLGTVGCGVYRVIETERTNIEQKQGISLRVKKVLAKQYGMEIPDEQKAADIADIVNDPEIDVVVELIGGEQPAKDFILAALEQGKTVVSANKHLIARCWEEIEATAKAHDAGFYYEASVGGGIPIIDAVRDALQANTITSIYSIINGTTNYILSKMSEEGGAFEDVLKEAQDLGYAEADPTSDVEGHDAANKLSILASLAFFAHVPLEKVYCEGITHITSEDIEYAREFGYTIKLLAIGKRSGDTIETRVHPTMIPLDHPLSSVRGSFNAVFLHGNAVDDLMFYGRGAGELPTASAVVSDIIYSSMNQPHKYAEFLGEGNTSDHLIYETNWECGYFLRLTVLDKPGVLADIARIFAHYGVSLASVLQKGKGGDSVPLIFVTHRAKENSVRKAIAEIKRLPSVAEVASMIRVEG
ncbi:MAG: homoserine dehydrogenase [Christensenellales bacterium]|jgi:homoserine dehydrogenase